MSSPHLSWANEEANALEFDNDGMERLLVHPLLSPPPALPLVSQVLGPCERGCLLYDIENLRTSSHYQATARGLASPFLTTLPAGALELHAAASYHTFGQPGLREALEVAGYSCSAAPVGNDMADLLLISRGTLACPSVQCLPTCPPSLPRVPLPSGLDMGIRPPCQTRRL